MITLMKSAAPPLLPILRSEAQGRLLADILLHPDEERSITGLVALSGSSLATVVREVNRFEQAGVAQSRHIGRNRMVRARADSPLTRPLQELLAATFGPPAVLAEELSGVDRIEAAYLYGSWTARYLGDPGPAPHDIDVLVGAADRAVHRLGLPVQITVRTAKSWAGEDDPFLAEVRRRPLLALAPPGGHDR
jgi:hypothetical protein